MPVHYQNVIVNKISLKLTCKHINNQLNLYNRFLQTEIVISHKDRGSSECLFQVDANQNLFDIYFLKNKIDYIDVKK